MSAASLGLSLLEVNSETLSVFGKDHLVEKRDKDLHAA
jgi:hypothetical protein